MKESFIRTVDGSVKLVFEVQEPRAYAFTLFSNFSRNDVKFLVREKDHESALGSRGLCVQSGHTDSSPGLAVGF